jgi:hypothetical protein
MTTTETENSTSRNGAGWTPPYTSFTTLTNTLDRMREEGGPPSRLDGSYLSNYAGGTRYAFLAALKSLGLVDDEGKPTPTLTELVGAQDEKRQREIVGDVLRQHYMDALSLPANATQAQLEAVFRNYGIGGSTLRKAIGFYLAAARFADVTVSRHFKLPKIQPSERAKKALESEQTTEKPREEPKPKLAINQDHPLIVGLFTELPPAGSKFSEEAQTAWFEIAKATFRLIYNRSEPDAATVPFKITPSSVEGAND